MSAFAGLGTLRHLDLHHVGVDEILRGDAESSRCDLLDRGAHAVAVRQRLEAVGLFAAFAGVGFAADAIHRNRQRGMGLARDRTERHRAGGEALDDLFRGLNFGERHRLALFVLCGFDTKQSAQRQQTLGLFVENFCERLVALLRVAARSVLEQRHRLGSPCVILAARAVRVFATDIERVLVDG